MSRDSVFKCLKALEGAGLIRRQAQGRGNGRGPNLYTLFPDLLPRAPPTR